MLLNGTNQGSSKFELSTNQKMKTHGFTFLFFILTTFSLLADWPQWRGPGRNGVVSGSPALANQWPKEGPKLLWRSVKIPSGNEGGYGSVVAMDGRVYASLVWQRMVPVESRTIDGDVLKRLGWREVNLPAKLLAKMEKDRLSLSSRLRGSKLNDWIKAWQAKNLTEKDWQRHQGWVGDRFKKGKAAIALSDLDRLAKLRNRQFSNDAAFRAWLEKEPYNDEVKKSIIGAVATQRKAGWDSLICMNSETGKQEWKFEESSTAAGSRPSGTPCFSNGRVYFAGDRHAYCLDAKTGEVVWKSELPGRPSAGSFLVVGNRAYLPAGALMALDTATGDMVWEQKDVKCGNASPTAWHHQGQHYILCNTGSKLACVDARDGKVLWEAPGGGQSSPVVSGDVMALRSRDGKLGLVAYALSPKAPRQLWSHPIDMQRNEASPLIYEGHVYLLGSDQHLCVSLKTGKAAWMEKRRSTISSPFVADGKIYNLERNGSELVMIKASPKAHTELGLARVQSMWCPSPAFDRGHLYLRMKDHVACYDLR